jgi:UDP-N-acetylglucosamine--N-acetylmuramyl-(pentapeptide) pyrophosphoryl-undecaprenol N-acetylglucosamine transferase
VSKQQANKNSLRIIISGGGTGGHVYPALAIADQIKTAYPDAVIQFVGAQGRMEMEKVPLHGYPIEGLWISGLQRGSFFKNITLPFKVLSSLQKVKSIIKKFKPDAVVGVGGYASMPLVYVASRKGIPALIQEQNSYPGITNKMLGKYVQKVCVAYPGLERFFPNEKIVYTGNPVRNFPKITERSKEEGFQYFNIERNRFTVLVVGGSLGARTINNSILKNINTLLEQDIQLIWQTGKLYYNDIVSRLTDAQRKKVRLYPFIDKMEYAYAVADVVVSRAGAITISELALVGKPAILVPSPNVAEDHQTKNAMVLASGDAAILVKDAESMEVLPKQIISLLRDEVKQRKLSTNIQSFAKPDAAKDIVNELLKLINK